MDHKMVHLAQNMLNKQILNMDKLNINETKFLQERKYLKKEFRRLCRVEVAKRAEKEKNDIMESRTYDSKTFHKLVQKQRNKGNNLISDLHVGAHKYSGTQGILEGFKQHFEQLAADRIEENFDEQYHRINSYEVSIISELVKDKEIPEVTINELNKAIKTLNKGKSPDIYGLQVEHILNAGKKAEQYLLEIINQIFKNGDIPELLKTGLLTPVFKRKGNKNFSTNYRGITVLPVVCKTIEVIIKERIRTKCDNVQNPLQRGFTRNASPMNAGLIVEEFLRESKDHNVTAHVILLDAKSAFDVVNHEHLLRRLYHIGIQDKHWSLISSLHREASSVVKWYGEQSESFRVEQGVRQGGILSADFYKIHLNPLLDRIQHSGLGARIGNVICNLSGCADDLAINTNNRREGQTLVNSATDFAGMERYFLQADKSVVVTVTPKDSKADVHCMEPLLMDGKEMKNVETAMHLGIHRAGTISKTGELNVDENLKKARRVVYSLMSSGMYGHNGLDPETNLHLVKTYVTPVLLYGLELVLPNKTHINKLEVYQKKMLKQILSLPISTPDVAVYIVSGFLPVEAQIDKKVLTLFNNVTLQDDSSVEKQLAKRQMTMKGDKSNSWFIHVKKTLLKYELCDIYNYLDQPIKKTVWKRTVGEAVNKYWQKEILSLVPYYRKLEYLNVKTFKPGHIHPLLKINVHSSRDIVRLPSKLKLMCGSYILQTDRQKFNKSEVDSTCPLCQRNNETIEHHILDCSALNDVRFPILQCISISYKNLTGKAFDQLSSNSKIQIIIDCSFLINQEKTVRNKIRIQDVSELEFHTRRLTHMLYVNRYSLLNNPTS